MIRVAINGFGRIGRILFRLLSNSKNYRVVAINDLAEPRVLSHLLKYDSIHGRFDKKTSYVDKFIICDGYRISVSNESNISDLCWKKHNIDIVFECTGKFRTMQENMLHIKAGAKRVILSSPPLDSTIPMIVLGVNDRKIKHSIPILSNASCTTNCAAPMIKVLDDNLGLRSAYVTTVHSYTSDQNLHDGVHHDLRRARSAGNSIIPTTTGAAKALSSIFPHIELGGCGIRVPVSNCSLTDITCVVKKAVSIDDINQFFYNASKHALKGILFYNEDPIVSIDVTSSTYSCIFDSQLTYVSGDMVKIVGWYDNEYGYCSRLVDLLEKK